MAISSVMNITVRELLGMQTNDPMSRDIELVVETLVLFLLFWLVAEVIFYIAVHFLLLPQLQKIGKPQPYPFDSVRYMKRILESVKDIEGYSFKDYVSGFFRGATFEDVHADNFRSFLSWAMYNKHLKDRTQEEIDAIEQVMEFAGKTHPVFNTLKPGFNPNIKHCAMTLEPIPVIHRPLCIYVGAQIMEAVANVIFLRACGFQYLEIGGISYWYRKQRNPDVTGEGSEPVLFLHGISTGWMLYLPIAKAMSKDRTLLLVDMDSIKIKSMRFAMPTPQQFCDAVTELLDRHRIPKVSVVGHSFGSITAGWFTSRCPERVSHLTLLDPVSLLLSFPDVSNNFLYRSPVKLTEWIIYLLAARELTISHMLHRNFWWYNNNFWLEDIPADIGVVVGLAEGDEIVNPVALEEYVNLCSKWRKTKSDPSTRPAAIKCLMWKGYSHGQILIPTETQADLIATVKESEKTSRYS